MTHNHQISCSKMCSYPTPYIQNTVFCFLPGLSISMDTSLARSIRYVDAYMVIRQSLLDSIAKYAQNCTTLHTCDVLLHRLYTLLLATIVGTCTGANH